VGKIAGLSPSEGTRRKIEVVHVRHYRPDLLDVSELFGIFIAAIIALPLLPKRFLFRLVRPLRHFYESIGFGPLLTTMLRLSAPQRTEVIENICKDAFRYPEDGTCRPAESVRFVMAMLDRPVGNCPAWLLGQIQSQVVREIVGEEVPPVRKDIAAECLLAAMNSPDVAAQERFAAMRCLHKEQRENFWFLRDYLERTFIPHPIGCDSTHFEARKRRNPTVLSAAASTLLGEPDCPQEAIEWMLNSENEAILYAVIDSPSVADEYKVLAALKLQ
jgi:hypothetical protein